MSWFITSTSALQADRVDDWNRKRYHGLSLSLYIYIYDKHMVNS